MFKYFVEVIVIDCKAEIQLIRQLNELWTDVQTLKGCINITFLNVLNMTILIFLKKEGMIDKKHDYKNKILLNCSDR